MLKQTLGRLERVETRLIWANEAMDFTPWLADNLQFLGDAIGVELQLEAQEKSVGLFRADILAKDVQANSWVLIENQLACTDHSHLGQLITYAAGLEAVTVVWIAKMFTDEHRAALDWLNTISDEGIKFFGVQVEVWSIGDSVAPKFNVVSRPNTWTKKGKGYKGAIVSSHKNFDKGDFIRQCLRDDPNVSIGIIQRKALEVGEKIATSYVSDVRKAFIAEQGQKISSSYVSETRTAFFADEGEAVNQEPRSASL